MLFCQSNSLVYHMCIRIWLLRTFSSMCKQRHYWFCHYNSLGIYRYGYLVALCIVFVVKRCHRRSGFCTDIIINLEWTHFRIKLQHLLVVILPNLSFLRLQLISRECRLRCKLLSRTHWLYICIWFSHPVSWVQFHCGYSDVHVQLFCSYLYMFISDILSPLYTYSHCISVSILFQSLLPNHHYHRLTSLCRYF